MNEKIEKSINEFFGDEKLSSVEKGNTFLKWVLSYIFDKTDTELEDNDLDEGVLMCEATNSIGIDAGFKDNVGLHIIKTRYGTSHSIEELYNFVNNVPRIFSEENDNISVGKGSREILNSLKQDDNIYLYYVTNGDISEEQYKNIELRIDKIQREYSEKKKDIKIIVLYSRNITDYIEQNTYSSNIPRKYRNKEVPMTLEKYFLNKQKDTIIAEVSLKTLATFVNKSKSFVFYSNIRNYLGKNNVNKKIAETYNNYPKDFWFYNNGITIVCDDFNNLIELKDGAGKINIVTPQIVNGCQTASTIYNCWNSEDLEKRKSKEGTILVKIIKDTNEKRKEITRYTNNQTAVTGKDLFALEDFHYKLQKNFEKLGYNYEIQRRNKLKRGKGCKVYNYLFDKKFKNNFYAKDISQSYAAGIFFFPAKARSICNIVPGGKYYDKLFNDKLTPENPKYYLFPYAVSYYSKYVLEYKNKTKFKSCSLLYTTIYFKLLLEIFKKMQLVDEEVENFINCNQEKVIDYIDKIFINEKLNIKLLSVADSILKNFLKDSTIKNEKIGDNLPKFLKSSVESDPKVISILHDKIMDEFEDENIDFEELESSLNN